MLIGSTSPRARGRQARWSPLRSGGCRVRAGCGAVVRSRPYCHSDSFGALSRTTSRPIGSMPAGRRWGRCGMHQQKQLQHATLFCGAKVVRSSRESTRPPDRTAPSARPASTRFTNSARPAEARTAAASAAAAILASWRHSRCKSRVTRCTAFALTSAMLELVVASRLAPLSLPSREGAALDGSNGPCASS